ncbi:hypothetical protein ODE11_15835 [Staphylococcus aureus]|nr:hypothetical protein [Staphylococcus aureus]
MMPKIVTVSQFEQPNEFYEYSNYVNYMKRGEAQNNKDDFKYDVYAHYMFDEEKVRICLMNMITLCRKRR